MFVGISSLILVFAGLVASVYFAYKFLNVDLELAFHALLQICAWSSQSYMIVVSFILWHKFLDMFPKLQQIYDESELKLFFKCKPTKPKIVINLDKHLDTFKFMEKAQQRSVIITKLLTNHMVIGWFLYCSLLGISSMIFSIIKFGHIDPKHLDVPFKFLYILSSFIRFKYFIRFFCVCVDCHGFNKLYMVGSLNWYFQCSLVARISLLTARCCHFSLVFAFIIELITK